MQRRSIRLQGYDYGQDGAYFVTICAHQRMCIFGDVIGDSMHLNDWGMMVTTEWERTAILREYVALDAFVVMPNHIHGIMMIQKHTGRGMMHHAPTEPLKREFSKPAAHSLPSIIGAFKSAVTRRIRRLPDGAHATIWQRNYYEHVIRNESSLNHLRKYILHNPMRWQTDSLYTA